MNAGLTAKISKLEGHLKSQQTVLQDKKREINNLRILQATSRHSKVPSDVRYHGDKDILKEQVKKKSATLEHSRTLTLASAKKRSASLTRHGNMLEAKHRQLAEEEGHAFRRQQRHHGKKDLTKWAWSGDTATQTTTETMSFKDHTTKGLSKKSEDGVKMKEGRRKAKKKVQFVAEALVLSAALEGELELLMECVSKVFIQILCIALLTLLL